VQYAVYPASHVPADDQLRQPAIAGLSPTVLSILLIGSRRRNAYSLSTERQPIFLLLEIRTRILPSSMRLEKLNQQNLSESQPPPGGNLSFASSGRPRVAGRKIFGRKKTNSPAGNRKRLLGHPAIPSARRANVKWRLVLGQALQSMRAFGPP